MRFAESVNTLKNNFFICFNDRYWFRSLLQPILSASRFDEQAVVAELFQNALKLAAAAMERLERMVHRENRVIRLDFFQKEQHLFLQRLRGGGHHGREGQLFRKLTQHEPEENRVVFQNAQIFPERHREAEHGLGGFNAEGLIACAAEFHIAQQGAAGGFGNIADGAVLRQIVDGYASFDDEVKPAQWLKRVVENFAFFKFHELQHRRPLPEMSLLLRKEALQLAFVFDLAHSRHLFSPPLCHMAQTDASKTSIIRCWEETTMDSLFDTKRLYRSYFKMALPVVLGLVVTLIYNLADTFFIAQTNDTNLIAGVSLCAPVFTALMAFGNIYGQGGSSLI